MTSSELVKKRVNEVNKKPKHKIVINSHMHIWNYNCIPEVFQERYEKIDFDIMIPLLGIFNNWYRDEDIADKLRVFLEISKKKTLEEVVDVLRREGSSKDPKIKQIFTPLMMDMEYARRDQIWKKILYGTDWWVNRMLCKEWVYLDTFVRLSKEYGINKERISYIINKNAVNFLGLNNNSFTKGPLINHVKFLTKNMKKLPPWFKFA